MNEKKASNQLFQYVWSRVSQCLSGIPPAGAPHDGECVACRRENHAQQVIALSVDVFGAFKDNER